VELERDNEPRTVEVPEAFAAALSEAGLRDRFDGLSYTHRKEYVRWIEEAKREETRERRLVKAIELLGQGVEHPSVRASNTVLLAQYGRSVAAVRASNTVLLGFYG